jgi:hypothetical protein
MRKLKTKRQRKINKFTNKNRLGGMLQETTILSIAIMRLNKLAELIVSGRGEGGGIKLGINEILGTFEQELSIPDQIEFIQTLNELFERFHIINPIVIEYYFMQIITLIDSTLSDPVDFESTQLAKLSNDSMRMMATAFRGRGIVIPTLFTIEEWELMQEQLLQMQQQ